MLRDHFVAFDDYLDAGVTSWSSDVHAERLAAHDILAMFACAYNEGDADGTVVIRLHHSGDGIHFVAKDEEATLSVAPYATTPICWYDDGSVPNLHFVRIGLSPHDLGDAGARVRVKVVVAMRDMDPLPGPDPVDEAPEHEPPADNPYKDQAQQVRVDTKSNPRGDRPANGPPGRSRGI